MSFTIKTWFDLSLLRFRVAMESSATENGRVREDLLELTGGEVDSRVAGDEPFNHQEFGSYYDSNNISDHHLDIDSDLALDNDSHADPTTIKTTIQRI
jgi:hypothetical protein